MKQKTKIIYFGKNAEVTEAENFVEISVTYEVIENIGMQEKINKIINTYEKEDGVEVYVTYEVLEDIGTNEKIVF